MAGFFVKFNTTVMDSINTLGATYQAQYASGIMSIMVSSITLYIAWVGYCTLAGKKQTPVPDLVWDLGKFAVITAFITNAGGFLIALTDGLQGLKDGFSGGTSVWATLDRLWESTQTLGDLIYKQDQSTYVPLEGGVGMFLVWVGSIVLMFISSLVFLTADLTMTFMVMTAPIFLFCLMFGFLRPMFNNWLQLLFSSILTVLFASLVIRLAIDFQADITAQVSAQVSDTNIVTMGAMGGVAGILAAALVTVSASFATKLAGAGAEGAIQGLAMAGVMKAVNPVANASKKGADKAVESVGNTLGAIGDKAASNLKGSPQARGKAAVDAMKTYNANNRW